MRQSNDGMEEAKLDGTPYAPSRYSNGDARKGLPYGLVTCSSSRQTIGLNDKKKGQPYYFDGYPDIKEATDYAILHA